MVVFCEWEVRALSPELSLSGVTANADTDARPNPVPTTVRNGWSGNRRRGYERRRSKERWPRYVWVDKIKRSAGKCENLDCLRDGPGGGTCVAGVEQAFDWEHTQEARKRKGISDLCCQLPLMPEAEWKEKIKAELIRGRCRLLCRNCHHLKTWHGMVMRYCAYV